MGSRKTCTEIRGNSDFLAPRPGLEPGTCGLTVTFPTPNNSTIHECSLKFKINNSNDC